MQDWQSCKTLNDIFNQTANKYPTNVAVSYINEENEEHLTYKELKNIAIHMSTCLRHLKASSTVIGILSRQNPNLVALLLGILQIPAAFAPIGLEWPPKMAGEFVKSLDSAIKVVVVEEEIVEEFNTILQLLDTNAKEKYRRVNDEMLSSYGFVIYSKLEECTPLNCEENLAYVMQTSGTTGSPKTVRVPHECIVPNITSLATIFNVSSEDCVALISPYTFDPFIVQLFIALSSGAKAAVVPDYVKVQPDRLCELLFDQLKTTILQPTPSLIYLMGQKHIKTKLLGQNSTLKILAFGGEPCPLIETLRKWKHTNCKTQIFNLYGITEVSSWASCYKITDDDLQGGSGQDYGHDNVELKGIINSSVPLGLPLDGTDIEVMDSDGNVIDEGIGTIYVGGERRTCYIDKETEPQTMRTTGDLGYIHNGQIWYYGRQNRQIKRMGKRMNLEWIEQTLSKSFPDHIFTSAAETNADTLQEMIYLFVKPPLLLSDVSQLIESIQKTLQEFLPVYAHPDCIHIVDAIPTTSHGKADTRRLLEDYHKLQRRTHAEVPMREFLMKTWMDSIRKATSLSWQLGANKVALENSKNDIDSQRITNLISGDNLCVGDSDKFVECGGTSMDAIRMINEVESWLTQKVGSTLELSELLDVILNGTFGKLCQYIERKVLQAKNLHLTPSLLIQGGPLDNVSTQSSEGNITQTTERLHSTSNSVVSQITETIQSSAYPIKGISQDSKLLNSHLVLPTATQNPQNHQLILPAKSTNNKTSKDITTTTSSPPRKRTKKEELQVARETDCFCSIQRGMCTTRCLICQKLCEDKRFENFSESRVAKKFEVSVEIQWKVDFHKCIDASPLLVGLKENAVVYLGSHAHIFKAVRLSDGRVLWETRVGDRIESSATISQCGSFVIVGCYDGKVYVFNRPNGSIAWTFQTSGPIKSSPCVDPSTGFVWIGSHDHHLYSLDINRQECVTSIDCGGSCFSSPKVLASHGLVFIATLTGLLLSVCTTRMIIKWKRQCPKPVFASPLVTSQGVVCACVDGKIYFYILSGELQWEFQTCGPVFSSPSNFSSRIVFGSHDNNVYCISNGGKLKWQFTADSEVYSSPFVALLGRTGESSMTYNRVSNAMNEQQRSELQFNCSGEHAGFEPVVWVCSTKGTLYCLSLDSGDTLVTWSLPGPVFSSPVIEIAGNEMLIGCRDDYLYCLEITAIVAI